MFRVENFDGKPLTKELAELRIRLEPLVEVTQIKGDGEAHPFLSPNDELADFDTWDRSNLNGTELKKKEMLQYEYARAALKTGLKLKQRLGINPYKFGMIGSTDAHTGLAAVEEENFFGKHSGVEPEPHRWEHVVIEAPDPTLSVMGWQQASAGYAAVWAKANTRTAIFDADAAEGSLCHHRFSHHRAVLWRLGVQPCRHAGRVCPATAGYAKGVPHGCATYTNLLPAPQRQTF